MTVSELARQIDAQLFTSDPDPFREVTSIHAASTMSSLIANASSGTLLVTSLCNRQLIRVAQLMDAPGLCLAGAARPDKDLLALARRSGIAILVSPFDMEETRRRLDRCLTGHGAVGQGAGSR